MPEPFDWTRQPEAAGPLTEPRSPYDGPALDLQAFAQGNVRLPRLAPMTAEQHRRGEYVPLSAPSPYIDHDPGFQARERAERFRRDLGRQQLRDAAMTAARDAILASTLTAQVLEGVDSAVDAAMQPAPAPVAVEPAPEAPATEAAEPVTAPSAEPEVRAAEPDPPPASSAEPAEVVTIRPRKQPEEKS